MRNTLFGLSALILAVASLFGFRHSKQPFAQVTTAFFMTKERSTWVTLFSGAALSSLTTVGGGHPVFFNYTYWTCTLYASKSKTHPLYWNE